MKNRVWVATVLALAALLGSCTSDQDDPFQLKVGDCLPEGSTGVVSKVKTVPCEEPHVGEIYDSVKVAQSEKFPGDAELTRQAGACEKSFEEFIGKPYAESTLKINYFHPTTESWERGDREILCIVENPAGTVVGSLKGTGR